MIYDIDFDVTHDELNAIEEMIQASGEGSELDHGGMNRADTARFAVIKLRTALMQYEELTARAPR